MYAMQTPEWKKPQKIKKQLYLNNKSYDIRFLLSIYYVADILLNK